MEKKEIKQLENWAKKFLGDDFDKFDFQEEIDKKISLGENKTILRQKFKVFLKEQLSKNDVKTIKEKEEYEVLQKFKEDEQQALELFEKDVFKLKKSEITITDKYKIPIEYIKSVANGYNKAFIFLGSAGIGKSFVTRQTLAKEGVKFVESRGVNSPLGFYQFLYENNQKDLTIVFDDVSGLVDNPNAFSILLGVLWEGLASWNSTSEKLKIPKQFIFKGRIIIIANKLSGSNTDIVKSRCLTYLLEMNREDILKMMFLIAKQPHPKLNEDERIKIVEFIKESSDNSTDNFDLRTQYKIEQLYLYDKKDWKELAKPLLLKNNVIEFLEFCLENNNSVKQAERQFCNEIGLSRRQFYNLKKINCTKLH